MNLLSEYCNRFDFKIDEKDIEYLNNKYPYSLYKNIVMDIKFCIKKYGIYFNVEMQNGQVTYGIKERIVYYHLALVSKSLDIGDMNGSIRNI